MTNYIIVSHEQVVKKFPQYKNTSQLPDKSHILPMSAMRFLAGAKVEIVDEVQLRTRKNKK